MTPFPPSLRRQVLAQIQPSPQRTRDAKAVARDVIQRLRRLALRKGLRVQPMLVGSLAKDTHLRDPLDIDVFILFPPTTPRSLLEKHGVSLGKAVLQRPVLKYAEHPYVHGRRDGFDLDVVPAYRLRDPTGRISAVDRTPFHTRYVRARASPRRRQEIRLFKRFLRGTRCYGAETATGGVSGYLAELLILKYRTFPKALAAIARWKAHEELALDGAPDPMGGPLVFIDPVDESRNAAAAVNQTTYDRLRRAAKAFLRRPGLQFFFPEAPRPASPERLRAELSKRAVLGLHVPAPPGRIETRTPQTQRMLAKVARSMEQEGFAVRNAESHALPDSSFLLLVEHEPRELPPTFEHRGPRQTDEEHARRFQARWEADPDVVGRPRLSGGRWTVTVRRGARSPAEILSGRVETLLEGFGFSVKERKEAHVHAGASLATDPGRHLALTIFLERLDPWDAPARPPVRHAHKAPVR